MWTTSTEKSGDVMMTDGESDWCGFSEDVFRVSAIRISKQDSLLTPRSSSLSGGHISPRLTLRVREGACDAHNLYFSTRNFYDLHIASAHLMRHITGIMIFKLSVDKIFIHTKFWIAVAIQNLVWMKISHLPAVPSKLIVGPNVLVYLFAIFRGGFMWPFYGEKTKTNSLNPHRWRYGGVGVLGIQHTLDSTWKTTQ